jgi:hypothetical protein
MLQVEMMLSTTLVAVRFEARGAGNDPGPSVGRLYQGGSTRGGALGYQQNSFGADLARPLQRRSRVRPLR